MTTALFDELTALFRTDPEAFRARILGLHPDDIFYLGVIMGVACEGDGQYRGVIWHAATWADAEDNFN